MLETLRKVMLAAQIKLGKVTANWLPLALMLTALVMLAICVSNCFKLLLLSICRVPTVFKLIPLRVVKKVLLMVTLSALERGPANANDGRAGRASQ